MGEQPMLPDGYPREMGREANDLCVTLEYGRKVPRHVSGSIRMVLRPLVWKAHMDMSAEGAVSDSYREA
jgi:hypothetical protein